MNCTLQFYVCFKVFSLNINMFCFQAISLNKTDLQETFGVFLIMVQNQIIIKKKIIRIRIEEEDDNNKKKIVS